MSQGAQPPDAGDSGSPVLALPLPDQSSTISPFSRRQITGSGRSTPVWPCAGRGHSQGWTRSGQLQAEAGGGGSTGPLPLSGRTQDGGWALSRGSLGHRGPWVDEEGQPPGRHWAGRDLGAMPSPRYPRHARATISPVCTGLTEPALGSHRVPTGHDLGHRPLQALGGRPWEPSVDRPVPLLLAH